MAKKRLTKLQKRMLILKDALAQIKLQFLKPAHMGVCDLKYFDDETGNGAKEILQKFKTENDACYVCARGSLLLAGVMRFNKFSVDDLTTAEHDGSYDEDSITDTKLKSWFSPKQLMMMETAFENSYNDIELGEDLWIRCADFGLRYRSPKRRLIAILENAIKNKGEFKP